MMKLILFSLFCVVLSVQSKITITNEIKLIKEGDPATLVCDEPTAKWRYHQGMLVNCGNCPSTKCNVDENYEKRVTASCNETHSVLYINSTRISDDQLEIRCPSTDQEYVQLHVGRYEDHFYSENNSTFALSEHNFTLVCDLASRGNMYWYNVNGELLSTFDDDGINTVSNYDTERFNITCNIRQGKGKLLIKNITARDDGKIFGCHTKYRKLSLFRLTVNVPITSVSLRPLSEPLIESKEGIFICEVEKSKPKASVEWIIFHKDGSSLNIQQNFTTLIMIPKGKSWRTKSILKLKLKRVFHKIICQARIENMPWTYSGQQLLDIHYSPEIVIHRHVTNLQYKAKISCEADANPVGIRYEMVQKWGETVRKEILTNYLDFKCFSFNDLGHWICRATNDVPKKDYYSEKSIEIKLNVSAQFRGKLNETATVGSVKHLKTCFYCYPEATDVKWYKGSEEMSSDRISYVPAEDGQFPFTGNCSILKLDVAEKGVYVFDLIVTNPVGKGTFEVTLDAIGVSDVPDVPGVPDVPDTQDSASSTIYIIIGCVIATLLLIVIFGGIYYFKFRRPSRTGGYGVTESKGKSSEDEISEGKITKGHGLTNESYYDSTHDINGSTGQEDGTEHQDIEMMGQPPVKDCPDSENLKN